MQLTGSGKALASIGLVGCLLAFQLSQTAAQTLPVATSFGAARPSAGAPQSTISVSSAFSSSTPPAYKSLRYDEDYSYLGESPAGDDCWDSVKYVPLCQDTNGYLSLGGEIRQRFEFYHNPNFGGGPSDSDGNNDWLLQRYLLHGDLHLSERLRIFGQAMTGLEDGRIGGPRPDIDRDVFDAHQAFADLKCTTGDMRSCTARIGRQEFDYGSGRLISAREAPNLRRSFDAVRLLTKTADCDIDLFWSRPVRNRPDVFDDDPNPDRSLWGLYAVCPLKFLPAGHADYYYLGMENEQGTFNQGTAYELRHTIGTRIWGKPLPWEYNTDLMWQFGKFGDGDIQAWAIASDTHYNFSGSPLQPRVGVTADLTSGDRDPNSPDLQTFNPLFPTGAYFNLADIGGPSNLIHVHPSLGLHFTERVSAVFDWAFCWRMSDDDSFYSIGVFPLRPGQPSRARYIGNSPSATVTWQPTRHITVLASYVHFFAGPYIQENPPGEDLDYLTTWVTYKF